MNNFFFITIYCYPLLRFASGCPLLPMVTYHYLLLLISTHYCLSLPIVIYGFFLLFPFTNNLRLRLEILPITNKQFPIVTKFFGLHYGISFSYYWNFLYHYQNIFFSMIIINHFFLFIIDKTLCSSSTIVILNSSFFILSMSFFSMTNTFASLQH